MGSSPPAADKLVGSTAECGEMGGTCHSSELLQCSNGCKGGCSACEKRTGGDIGEGDAVAQLPTAPALAARDFQLSPLSPLATYFLTSYTRGEMYEGPEYVLKWDASETPVLEHEKSGLLVWAHAFDLRDLDEKEPAMALFHYLSMDFFEDFSRSIGAVDVCASLTSDKGEFGRGIYTTQQDPLMFGSKEAALCHLHWPREEVCSASGGIAEAGPLDPVNKQVCQEIAADESLAEKTRMCIPMLVPKRMAYNFRERQIPDMAAKNIPLGSNLLGERQFPGRDVWVLHLAQEEQQAAAKSSLVHQVQILGQWVERYQKALGDQDRVTLTAESYHARLLVGLTQFYEAEVIHKSVLQRRKEIFGEKHVETANSMACLGELHQANNKKDEAEQDFRRAFEIREAVLGPMDLSTLASIESLAQLLRQVGKMSEGELLLWRAMEGRESIQGPMHYRTLGAVASLATLLQSMGHPIEAEPLHRRAFEGREQLLGPNDPRTLTSASSLASALQETNRMEEALPMHKRAADGLEAALGKNHPETLSAVNNYASLLKLMGRFEEAEPLYRRALEGKEATHGQNHPNTLTSMNNLAALLKAMERYGEAEPLYRRALEGRERVLGPMHRRTLASVNNLAVLLAQLGQKKEAAELFARVAESNKNVLGDDHPETVAALKDLASIERASGVHSSILPSRAEIEDESADGQ